jgi:signal peptidase I
MEYKIVPGAFYQDKGGSFYIIEKVEGDIVTYKNEEGQQIKKHKDELIKELTYWEAH